MSRGKFITLEGGEGVGKSTNLAFIQGFLKKEGVAVITTREPGGTPLAEKIRDLLLGTEAEQIDPMAELLMVFAARAQHIKHVIEPALQNGEWVLCDRFTDATYAYQGGGRGMDVQIISQLEQFVQGDLIPDLTLLLDTTVETGMKRAKNRGNLDRFELEQQHFFEKVRQSYLQRADRHKNRFKVINASRTLSDVQSEIKQAVSKLWM